MTTWLTQITPDYRNDHARSDLRDVIAMHKRVMMLVPDGLGDQARRQVGILYRVDDLPRRPRILVQTQMQPQLHRLPAGYGPTETRELDPLLNWLTTGVLVRYRITANTCKRKSHPGKHEPKAVALRGTAADDWWTDRAERSGLQLQSLLPHPLDDAVGGSDRCSGIRHAMTRFDGVAFVADPVVLRQAILTGVGRGKSHGCGLLSIAPARASAAAA
jgi:CRISPR system Cascade subunit CasE